MNYRMSNKSYREDPCKDIQFTCCPNYVYRSVKDLAKLLPQSNQKGLVWCRTVGVLDSFHGRFYVSNINSTGGIASDRVQVSFAYLKLAQSARVPCPIQVFGSIQWHSLEPVLYVKLIQVLTIPRALQMKDTMEQLLDFKCQGHMNVTS